ncbi:RNA polymerase sigma factor [Leifsonia sp. TF02-11]|uniref:RNA polymerase sigma factor n=1 Tax=Leifsonia sp. TF02-11 TaxID=2815212 RepID=UPI001AA14352|nr:sigma-70 family RNA polymerase sigma factor [Leifsonia sp. TF02-11]MBO1741214.1 sigma-70 family RNA polymerase sigma factor [Leifsonia sp. TF02-11]
MYAPTPESTGSSVDDRPAVERLRHGDRDALTELYQRHGASVYWNAYGVLRSRPDAEEMTADAFLTLWTRRREVQLYGVSALPWLIVTVKNLSRNRLRANQRRTAESLDAADPPSGRASAEDLAALDEAMGLVREVVDRLPAVDREIFRLCLVEELTYKEAAAALGLKHGSVRNRLSRMRTRLQSELGPRS